MEREQIKTKDRVRDLGEVYTNKREVNAMLDLVGDITYKMSTKILEPTCGNGNFLDASYRLLMQNKSLYTIENEYFENEKGFPKPKLRYINEKSFISLIIEKKKYISENFDKKIPIAIFYENENTLLRFKNILKKHNKFKFFQKQNKLTFTDKEEDSLNYDILFVDVNKISGREFPVVIAPIIKNSNDSNIYIMLSRAKYDLTLITKDKNSINSKIERLIHNKIIE
jgi:hypothetical protein